MKSESLNRSSWGFPFQRRYRINPQHKWCRVFGGYTVPSIFRASKTNLVNQCCNSSVVSSHNGAMEVPVDCSRDLLHSSHTPLQYFVSCIVFFGTPAFLASIISVSVLGAANRGFGLGTTVLLRMLLGPMSRWGVELVLVLCSAGVGTGACESDSDPVAS